MKAGILKVRGDGTAERARLKTAPSCMGGAGSISPGDSNGVVPHLGGDKPEPCRVLPLGRERSPKIFGPLGAAAQRFAAAVCQGMGTGQEGSNAPHHD